MMVVVPCFILSCTYKIWLIRFKELVNRPKTLEVIYIIYNDVRSIDTHGLNWHKTVRFLPNYENLTSVLTHIFQ